MPFNLSRFRRWVDLLINLSRFMWFFGEKSRNLFTFFFLYYYFFSEAAWFFSKIQKNKSHKSGEIDRQICSTPKSGEVDEHFCPSYSRWADLPLLRISLYCFSACRSEDPTHITLTKDTKQENNVRAVCVLFWLCELNNDTVCESS